MFALKNEKISYKIAQNIGEREQYYKLRNKIFMTFYSYNYTKDAYDNLAIILIATVHDQVVAGLRILQSDGSSNNRLPLTKLGINLEKHIPNIGNKKCIEMSGVCVSKNYRKTNAAKNLIFLSLLLSQYLKGEYFIYVSALKTSLHFSKIIKSLGYGPKMLPNKIKSDTVDVDFRINYIKEMKCSKPSANKFIQSRL